MQLVPGAGHICIRCMDPLMNHPVFTIPKINVVSNYYIKMFKLLLDNYL